MLVHWFQHVPFEGLGTIKRWLDRHNHSTTCTRMHAGDPVPLVHEYDWLIVMGGPMGVNDDERRPWLAAEKVAVKAALAAGKRVLGICLGAQLMASVLGATVTRNEHREIGWWPISAKGSPGSDFAACLPEPAEVFHWHGDTFAIPGEAEPLWRSAACRNQAFALGNRVLGLQFHLETTPMTAQALIDHCGDELSDAPYVQTPEEILLDPKRFQCINRAMDDVLTVMAAG